MKEPSFIAAPPNWEKLHHHPYASIIPMYEGMDWDAFKHSIRDGYIQRNPIILYRDNAKSPWKIINGRHCHQACIEENIVPTFAGLENDDDAARKIAKMDANRRHLNASQRALVIATLSVNLCKQIDKGSPTQSQMAEQAGVSRPVMNDAVKVVTKGTPDLQQAVATKDISVSEAAGIADQTEEDQKEEVAKRKTKKANKKAGKSSANGHVEPKKITDDNGVAIPERLWPIFENVGLYGSCTAALHKAVNGLQAVEVTASYLLAEKEIIGDKRRYSTSCLTAIHKLKCFRPCLLCDACDPAYEPSEDAELCEKCGGKGYLTGEELEP